MRATTGSSDRPPSFRIVPGEQSSAVILPVPHDSRAIPLEVRGQLLLDDAELASELERMTGLRTDEREEM